MQHIQMATEPKFIVDHNAGKLVKLLRSMGYDTTFFNGENDSAMVTAALTEDRVIITRDTQIIKRRAATKGRLKVILLKSDKPEEQIRHIISTMKLDCHFKPFSRCLECNQPLVDRSKEQVKDLVPPRVFKTQDWYMQCPLCHRIYWKGTHWQRMTARLQKLSEWCSKSS